jgi:hypothetical protein
MALEGWERARELRRELKKEWSKLWMEKYDDEVRAEDVSKKEFNELFVDKGEIIYATRDYRPLSFREIVDRHLGSEMAEKISPDPAVGGWRKFIRENLPKHKQKRPREQPIVKADVSQHQRKGGHGWLNKARIRRKIRLSRY